MSAEATPPELEWTPSPNETEVERIRREDPEFPTVIARCFAKIKGETYKPEKHGPHAPTPFVSRRERAVALDAKTPGNLSDLIERFMAGGPRRLRALPSDRPDVERVRDQ